MTGKNLMKAAVLETHGGAFRVGPVARPQAEAARSIIPAIWLRWQ